MTNIKYAKETTPGSPFMPKARAYLDVLLPSAWERFFNARRAGRYYGLEIRCPVCGQSPPAGLKYGGRRWRWLTVRMAEHTRIGKRP